jgi:hypothetical protein
MPLRASAAILDERSLPRFWLPACLQRIHATGADIVKFATMANDITGGLLAGASQFVHGRQSVTGPSGGPPAPLLLTGTQLGLPYPASICMLLTCLLALCVTLWAMPSDVAPVSGAHAALCTSHHIPRTPRLSAPLAADAYRVLSVLRRCPVPCIALAMGERGQITRLLAPKYGGFLTFGALSPDRVSGVLSSARCTGCAPR